MTVTPFPEDQADFSPFPEDQEGYFDAQAEAIAADQADQDDRIAEDRFSDAQAEAMDDEQADQPDRDRIAEDRYHDAQADAMEAQLRASGETVPSTDLF